jgi:hypothetical protein
MPTNPKAVSSGLLAATLCLSKAAAGPDASAGLGASTAGAGDQIPVWDSSFQIGYLHQLESDIDNGGSFSVNRANLSAGVTRVFDRSRTIGLSLGYGYDGYDFSDAAADPWSDIHSLSLALPIRWSLSDSWGLLAIPTIRSSGASGSSFPDSLSGGFLGGVSYRFGDHLTIGPGIGVLTQIEDDTSVFPILIVQWRITNSLELETGRGFGASQGPGLNLNWQATDKWMLSLGSRYESFRFRLDDTGAAPDGIGEEKGIPVYLGASYTTSKTSELSFYAGAKFGGTIALEDRSGQRIDKNDNDTVPFAGITWKLQF